MFLWVQQMTDFRGHAGGNKTSITVSTNTMRDKVQHMTMLKLKKDLQVQKKLDIGPEQLMAWCLNRKLLFFLLFDVEQSLLKSWWKIEDTTSFIMLHTAGSHQQEWWPGMSQLLTLLFTMQHHVTMKVCFVAVANEDLVSSKHNLGASPFVLRMIRGGLQKSQIVEQPRGAL